MFENIDCFDWMLFLFSDVMLFLLQKIANVIVEKIDSIALDHLMLELKLIMTDIQKVKNDLQDFTTSFVTQSVNNFQNAMEHLQVPLLQKQEFKHEFKQEFDQEFKHECIDDIFSLIKKDPLKDARKYFDRAIDASTQALSLKKTSLENYLICLQIQIMSQLYTENFQGASAIIRIKLKEFMKKPEISTLYNHLYFDGADLLSEEINLAFLICKFINKLKLLKVIDNEFIKNDLHIRVARSKFHPSGKCGTWIDISNPMIKLKTTKQKVVGTIKQSGIIVTKGIYGCVLMSIAIPTLLLGELFMIYIDTHDWLYCGAEFGFAMKHFVKDMFRKDDIDYFCEGICDIDVGKKDFFIDHADIHKIKGDIV
jgi:hypothetical protein